MNKSTNIIRNQRTTIVDPSLQIYIWKDYGVFL